MTFLHTPSAQRSVTSLLAVVMLGTTSCENLSSQGAATMAGLAGLGAVVANNTGNKDWVPVLTATAAVMTVVALTKYSTEQKQKQQAIDAARRARVSSTSGTRLVKVTPKAGEKPGYHYAAYNPKTGTVNDKIVVTESPLPKGQPVSVGGVQGTVL